jgi:two-component system, LytTR family, response regulator
MITALLIDDETKALQSLQWELQQYCPEVSIQGTFSNPLEALIFLKKNPVDCIFLDIEMPEMDGFQFLKNFPNPSFQVIITTAFNHYAIKALKEKAVDYLLKPVESEDLVKAVTKVMHQVEQTAQKETLEKTLSRLSNSLPASLSKISFSADGKVFFLHPDELLYCESDGNYCTLFLTNGKKILLTQKLKMVEEKLIHHNFFRVHNSFIINLTKIKEYHKADEMILLEGGAKIPVSRQKKSTFLDRI